MKSRSRGPILGCARISAIVIGGVLLIASLLAWIVVADPSCPVWSAWSV